MKINKQMKQRSFIPLVSLVFAVLCVGFLTTRFVFARNGDGGGDGSGGRNGSQSNEDNRNNEVSTNTITANEVEQPPKNETNTTSDSGDENESKNTSRNDNNDASDDSSNDSSNDSSANNTSSNEVSDNETRANNSSKAEGKERGKSCEARQTAVEGIINRSVARGNRIVTVFTKITNETEALYVKNGNTLTNYDALVSETATKKQLAQDAITVVKNLAVFTCPQAESKSLYDQYKSVIRAEIQALKDYKTSVKNLVEGVESVQPEDADTTQANTTNTVPNETNTTNGVSQ